MKLSTLLIENKKQEVQAKKIARVRRMNQRANEDLLRIRRLEKVKKAKDDFELLIPIASQVLDGKSGRLGLDSSQEILLMMILFANRSAEEAGRETIEDEVLISLYTLILAAREEHPLAKMLRKEDSAGLHIDSYERARELLELRKSDLRNIFSKSPFEDSFVGSTNQATRLFNDLQDELLELEDFLVHLKLDFKSIEEDLFFELKLTFSILLNFKSVILGAELKILMRLVIGLSSGALTGGFGAALALVFIANDLIQIYCEIKDLQEYQVTGDQEMDHDVKEEFGETIESISITIGWISLVQQLLPQKVQRQKKIKPKRLKNWQKNLNTAIQYAKTGREYYGFAKMLKEDVFDQMLGFAKSDPSRNINTLSQGLVRTYLQRELVMTPILKARQSLKSLRKAGRSKEKRR